MLDARFEGGLQDAGRYAVYLLGMHRTLAAFDAACRPLAAPPGPHAALAPARSRLTHLRADLAALGLVPLSTPLLAFDCPASWLGGCYVVEGSALGARRLLDQLGTAAQTTPTRFLEAHARAGTRWRQFLAQLDARPDTEIPALVAGATRLFTLADESFACAERALRLEDCP